MREGKEEEINVMIIGFFFGKQWKEIMIIGLSNVCFKNI